MAAYAVAAIAVEEDGLASNAAAGSVNHARALIGRSVAKIAWRSMSPPHSNRHSTGEEIRDE